MNGFAPSFHGETVIVLSPSCRTTGERNSTETAEYAGPNARPPTWIPAIVTPAAIRACFAGGGGVGFGCVLVGGVVTVDEVSVGVESDGGGGGPESPSAYAAPAPATPRASITTRSAARFTAAV